MNQKDKPLALDALGRNLTIPISQVVLDWAGHKHACQLAYHAIAMPSPGNRLDVLVGSVDC